MNNAWVFCFVLFIVNQYEIAFQSLNIFQGFLILFLWARSILEIWGKNSQWQTNMKNKLTGTKSVWSLLVLHSAGVRDNLSEMWIQISGILMCLMARVSSPLESSLGYPHPFLWALSALHSQKTQQSSAPGDLFLFQKTHFENGRWDPWPCYRSITLGSRLERGCQTRSWGSFPS